jgi:ABC-type tungstate transport system permease subunit
MVHSKPDEEKFVADGWGVKRYDVMYNDFIIVGPAADPAKIAGVKDPVQAFKQIAEAKAPFASRADDSGTKLRPSLSSGRVRAPMRKLQAVAGTLKPVLASARPSTRP